MTLIYDLVDDVVEGRTTPPEIKTGVQKKTSPMNSDPIRETLLAFKKALRKNKRMFLLPEPKKLD